jgi:hypothetical protein
MKPMADIAVQKTVFVVFREQHNGSWQEIYITKDEQSANNEAEKMAFWDARTKVVKKSLTVFEQVSE